MFSIAAGALSFQASPLKGAVASRSAVSMTAITPGDVGTTPPLGVYDPLGAPASCDRTVAQTSLVVRSAPAGFGSVRRGLLSP